MIQHGITRMSISIYLRSGRLIGKSYYMAGYCYTIIVVQLHLVNLVRLYNENISAISLTSSYLKPRREWKMEISKLKYELYNTCELYVKRQQRKPTDNSCYNANISLSIAAKPGN